MVKLIIGLLVFLLGIFLCLYYDQYAIIFISGLLIVGCTCLGILFILSGIFGIKDYRKATLEEKKLND